MLLDEVDFVHRAKIVQDDLRAIVANRTLKNWIKHHKNASSIYSYVRFSSEKKGSQFYMIEI